MIVLLTHKQDSTADRVVDELHRRRVPFVRVNTEDFPARTRCSIRLPDAAPLAARLDLDGGRQLSPEQVTAVWYRRPEPSDIDPRVTDRAARRFAAQEARAALDGLLALAPQARWVNRPHANRAGEIRPAQLKAAAGEGLLIPNTLITNDSAEARAFHAEMSGAVVVKSIGPAFHDPRHTTRVYTSRVHEEHLAHLDDDLAHAPVLLQEQIAKRLEIRLTLVGDQVFAAQIDSQASLVTKDDWRRDALAAPHAVHHLPDEIAAACLRVLSRFDLQFGTMDLILTPDGRYVFLELNPNGEWDWIEALTGLPIASALADLLREGC